MAVYGGPEVVSDGLDIVVDTTNTKSYLGSGSSWINIIDRTNPETANNTWGNSFTAFTILSFIDVLGNNTGYAYHPISKWNTGTNTASFVLYHFQNYQGNNDQNKFGWYANAGGTWKGITPRTNSLSIGTHFIGVQFNSTNGGQLWIDGNPYGSRGGGGTVGTGTGNINIDGGPDARAGIHHVKSVHFYSKELSNAEIKQNYAALRGRFGL